MIRGQNNPKAQIVQDEVPEVELIDGDLTDLSSLIAAVEQVQPDEVYNLGAISFVKLSFSQPELTADVTGSGVLRMLEAIRIVGGAEQPDPLLPGRHLRDVRQGPRGSPARDDAVPPPLPVRHRQGVRLLHDPQLPRVLRHPRFERHPVQPHQPRRGLEFVERKITNAVARISLGLQDMVTLGNLDTSRDFGYAGDYVEAMWRMLQQDEPGDYVVATGRTWSIRQVLDMAFAAVGIDDWTPYVATDDRFLRPAEVDQLVGDSTQAREVLGWEPKVDFPDILAAMVENDVEAERVEGSSRLVRPLEDEHERVARRAPLPTTRRLDTIVRRTPRSLRVRPVDSSAVGGELLLVETPLGSEPAAGIEP